MSQSSEGIDKKNLRGKLHKLKVKADDVKGKNSLDLIPDAGIRS